MEEEIEKKIKYLKELIKEKTDLGTANYVGEELRKLCGMVETEALSQHDVSESVCPNFDTCINKGKNEHCSLEVFECIDCFIGQNEH